MHACMPTLSRVGLAAIWRARENREKKPASREVAEDRRMRRTCGLAESGGTLKNRIDTVMKTFIFCERI